MTYIYDKQRMYYFIYYIILYDYEYIGQHFSHVKEAQYVLTASSKTFVIKLH